MATKEAVLNLIDSGKSYEEAGAILGLPAGQAYLVATGLPADGSDDLAPEDRERPGILKGRPQALVNPRQQPESSPQAALDFLKRRVAADPALRDAAKRREATPPPPELPEEDEARDDVVDVLGRDHNQVKFLLEQVEAIPAHSKGGSAEDASRRQSILDMITIALAGHEAAEEAHFWPMVSSLLADGEQMAKEATTQEQEAKQTLESLGDKEPTAPEFDELVEQLSSELRKHVAFEDKVLLHVRSSIEQDERVRVGKKILQTEKVAPTHPHAGAGSSRKAGPAGGLVGAADRRRDAAGGRPGGTEGKGCGR